MAKLLKKDPHIIELEYRQEKGDPDYGSCMWAVFLFDIERYDMLIMSDCGNYSYGWVPTPESESFLHLMDRLDDEYILEKLSSQTVIDVESTKKAVMEYIEDLEDAFSVQLKEDDVCNLENACYQSDERDILDEIHGALLYTDLDGKIDDYDLLCCIEKDYPAGAKKIVEVIMQYVIPKLRELDDGRQNQNNLLTLDELRKMDGEPVWIKSLTDQTERWGLVALFRQATSGKLYVYIYDTGHGERNLSSQEYGMTWLAYRRKPEEEHHNGE